MQNIIFGLMVLIAVGAGVVTCIYEVGGFQRHNTGKQTDAEQTIKKD